MRGSVRLVSLVVAVSVVGLAGRARAETRRVAVVVGNNAGSGVRPALRFAESDAAKLAGVLEELGGFAPADVLLLQGGSLAGVGDALATVRRKLAAARQAGPGKTVLLFYFSGHSDGEALELGSDRFAFSELRRVLGETGADVRVAIIDSCQSGALLAQKSGRPGPSFEIRLHDDVASTGEAFLTSSAAHETALESAEIRGSFFSHHLISGLRGAADVSGDGRVTLSEAYHYAFDHTLTTTTNTIYGPQHPAYDFRLSGQGEVVLTELLPRSSTLIVPDGYQRILVEERRRGQVVVEWAAGGARRLAVPAGPYQLWAYRDGESFLGSVDLPPEGRQEVRAEDLRQTWVHRATGKGGDLELAAGSETASPRWLFAAGGVRAGVAHEQGLALAARLGLRPSQSGWVASLDLGLGNGPGFSEKSALLSGGYGFGLGRGMLRGLLTAELSAGAVLQTVDGEASAWTPAAGATLAAGGSLWLTPALAVVAEASLPVLALERDGAASVAVLPALTLGLAAGW
jgi:hypothetical protein